MTATLDIKQQIAAEQQTIAAMTDPVEQALAQAALTWRVNTMKGEKGARERYQKANQELTEYRNQKTIAAHRSGDPEWFANSRRAAEWLLDQGYLAKQGGGPLSFDAARKFVDTLRKEPGKGYHIDIVRRGADNKYGAPAKKAEEQKGDESLGSKLQAAILRKNEADATKKEMEVEEMCRDLDDRWIPREESEEREAVLIGLLKDCFRHRIYLDNQQLMLSTGIDPEKQAEFTHHLQLFVNTAFNDFSRISSIDLEIEDEDELQ